MNLLHNALAATLRHAGWRCFAPPPPPALWSEWLPRTGPLREVVGLTESHVTYRCGTKEVTVTLGTWHRWRTRARAKLHDWP